jgi:hypothetical protein
MGLKEIHSSETALPFGIGPTIRTTKIINTKTGEVVAEGAGDDRKEANRNARSRIPSSSGSGGSSRGCSSDSNGGCYITTACLDAMDLPRNSLEMQAMKILTKEHILKSFSGKVDYVRYGKKAPGIVQAIESREDAPVIWKGVYERLKEVTTNVLSGAYARAHEQYKDLVLGLEKQFAK